MPELDVGDTFSENLGHRVASRRLHQRHGPLLFKADERRKYRALVRKVR